MRQGETGCGKSSVVPILLYHDAVDAQRVGGPRTRVRARPQRRLTGGGVSPEGHGAGFRRSDQHVNIVITQPRRLAARSLARRVASELKQDLGHTVGYSIGRESVRSRYVRAYTAPVGPRTGERAPTVRRRAPARSAAMAAQPYADHVRDRRLPAAATLRRSVLHQQYHAPHPRRNSPAGS